MTDWTPDDGPQVAHLYFNRVRGLRLGPIREVGVTHHADGPKSFFARSVFIATDGGGHAEVGVNADDRDSLLTPEERAAEAKATGVRTVDLDDRPF